MQYKGIPATLEPNMTIEGETFIDAVTKNIAHIHGVLRSASRFEGAPGHKITGISIAEAPSGIDARIGGKHYRRVTFNYDTLPDVFERFSTGLAYSYDFEVPIEEKYGPAVDLNHLLKQ